MKLSYDEKIIMYFKKIKRELNMVRPTSKTELISAATQQYAKLQSLISQLTEEELKTPFDFSKDEKKKEAHWKRDKNLRDVLIHLYEWQQLLLDWVHFNQNGVEKSFLPAAYIGETMVR